MKKPPYVIVHAETLGTLQSLVNVAVAEGYRPIGGPFNASAFNPPHNTVAQSMVLSDEPATSTTKPIRKHTKAT